MSIIKKTFKITSSSTNEVPLPGNKDLSSAETIYSSEGTVELFEKHNLDKFDIYGFYNGSIDGSDIQNRIFNVFQEKLINISFLRI